MFPVETILAAVHLLRPGIAVLVNLDVWERVGKPRCTVARTQKHVGSDPSPTLGKATKCSIWISRVDLTRDDLIPAVTAVTAVIVTMGLNSPMAHTLGMLDAGIYW